MRILLSDAITRYGAIANGVWNFEGKWCKGYIPPEYLKWVNSATGRPVTHIYCNVDMIPALDASLKAVLARHLEDQLKTFDGCFMVRDVRGLPGHPSCHSYALAIDINAAENKLGEEPTLSTELVSCFTEQGFSWGGDFSRKDGMHFSFAWE